jgi:hypothetical protein
MKRMHTHPLAEKLQVKFSNLDYPPGDVKDVKKTISVFNQSSDLSKLQQDFSMRDERYDLQREFEIQYEQFISNISGSATKNAHT